MGKLRLSDVERERSAVLGKILKSSLGLAKAAELLKVSYRPVLRLWKRFQDEGAAGLKHGLRGRVLNRQFDEGRRERVLD